MILLLALGFPSSLTTAPGPVAAFAAATPSHEERLRALVAEPIPALLADASTTRGSRIITLSNAAEACLRHAQADRWSFDESLDAISRLSAAAIDRRIRPFDSPDGPFDEHNLFLTHWLIVVASLGRLDPLHSDVRRGPAIAHHLRAASLAHPSGIAASFPSPPARWPADQAATLYALTLADRTFGLDVSSEPIARYTTVVPTKAGTVPGLPVSEWTGTQPLHDRPRGSAVTWTVRYLADVAPELARAWWVAGKPTFQSEGLGLHGFREWPERDDHPADVDSGPILLGMSTAATAFAIGASRSVDDCAMFHALSHTQSMVEEMVRDPDASAFSGVEAIRAVQSSALAVAVAANQATIPTRCPDPPPHRPAASN